MEYIIIYRTLVYKKLEEKGGKKIISVSARIRSNLRGSVGSNSGTIFFSWLSSYSKQVRSKQVENLSSGFWNDKGTTFLSILGSDNQES